MDPRRHRRTSIPVLNRGQPACFLENFCPGQPPLFCMPRMARAVLVGVAHHLTQRGLDRRTVFQSDADYETYLSLTRSNAQRYGMEILGYCLMPNHVHWIVIPQKEDSLARTFGDTHGRYASYANTRLGRSGHFWQNRFFSCAMDRSHLWHALRYVERNPVRAQMIDSARLFPWSSAAVHAGYSAYPDWRQSEPMKSSYSASEWEVFLNSETMLDVEITLRQNTYTGRPTGSSDFVAWAEESLHRRLAPQQGGRTPRRGPERETCGQTQMVFSTAK